GVDVQPDDLDGVAHQSTLDLLGSVVFVCTNVERDNPVPGGNHLDARGRIFAIPAPGNLVDAADALTQLTAGAPVLVVLLQKGAAARRQVGRQRVQVACIVLLAVRGPALHLLPDVEREGIHTLGR